MRRRLSALRARFGAMLGADAASVRQSLFALTVTPLGSLVAGLTLGAATGQIEALPGLLLLVPAAIGARGNVFAALGSRLGTAIHAGTFTLTRRVDSLVGQNVAAAAVLTFGQSLLLALLAKGMALAFNLENSIDLADYVVISIVGGVLASAAVLAITLALAAGSVRFGWDLDNVSSPLISSMGDVATLPALILAAELADIEGVTVVVSIVLAAAATAVLLTGWLSRLELLRSIVRESLPVLVLAGVLSLLAGMFLEKRQGALIGGPALLVMTPAFISAAGALGTVLSSRLSTKLHLGLVVPAPLPSVEARRDIGITFLLSLPVFIVVATVSHFGSVVTGIGGPPLAQMVAAALLGGMLATVIATAVAYYGTIAAVRFGADPDTYGIPLVTSALDVVGAFTLVLAIVVLRI